MTRNEIFAKIESAIAGQGSAIDQGGALAAILSQVASAAVALEVEDIKGLTSEQLDSLEAGDKVVKKTGKQKHTYTVSYKGEGVGEGLCLTYVDASVVETQSYDHTDSGWVYNGEDKTPLGQ